MILNYINGGSTENSRLLRFITTALTLFATLFNVAFSLVETPLVDTQDGRVNKMKLRGYNIPEGDTQYIYPISLNECLKANKNDFSDSLPALSGEASFFIAVARMS
jgi:hypothetical protein